MQNISYSQKQMLYITYHTNRQYLGIIYTHGGLRHIQLDKGAGM